LHCGYYGRTGIFEILVVNDAIRSLISSGVDSKTIQEEAVRGGMTTMRMDGADKVMRGWTSVAEIMRQTQEEAVEALNPELV
jgi:general secretion pathway protein E